MSLGSPTMPIDKNKRETTSVTLSKEVMSELREVSQATGISISKLIELAIRSRPCYEGLKKGIARAKIVNAHTNVQKEVQE